MFRPHPDGPYQFCRIGAQVNQRASLVHIQAEAHPRVRVPELLPLRPVEDILPQGAFRAGVGTVFPVEVGKLAHGHIGRFALFFELPVVGHSVPVAFQQKVIIRLPAALLAHPARTHVHHIVGISPVIFHHRAVLVDQIHEVRDLAIFVHHPAQDVLGVRAVVGTGTIEDRHQIAREVRDRHDANIILFVRRRAVDISPGRDPGIPGSAVEERVPGVIRIPVRFRALLPASRHGDLDLRVFLFNIIDQLRIHIVGAGGSRIKSKYLVELSHHLIYDPAFIFHGIEPDGQLFRLETLSEFLALDSQESGADLIPVLLVVLFGNGDDLLVEQARIGHLNGGSQPVLMSDLLLGEENID